MTRGKDKRDGQEGRTIGKDNREMTRGKDESSEEKEEIGKRFAD
jgi:hypothetical protein